MQAKWVRVVKEICVFLTYANKSYLRLFSVRVFGFKGFYQQRPRQRPRQKGGASRRPRQRLEEPQGLEAQKPA